MAPTDDPPDALAVPDPRARPPRTEAEALAVLAPLPPREERCNKDKDLDEWVEDVDDVSAQIKGIIDGSITDFAALDHKMELKARIKEIREEELIARRNKFFLFGNEGKGEGTKYKWWCRRCFVEYLIDLPENKCTRCQQSDKMLTQQERRDELMDKLEDYKKNRAGHQWRKDKWLRWKKSQKLLGRSRIVNYKAWEFWEPETDTEDEGDPIVPKDNPEFRAMEADLHDRKKKAAEKAKTAERFRQKGNECMKDNDFVQAIEHYEEGLEYQRSNKALWTNKALAELKVFRWQDAIQSCNKVIEYTEIFEDGFTRSSDSCFKAFMRRAAALRALHRWAEAVEDLEDAVKIFPKDREARDLLEKTRLARAESEQADSLSTQSQAEPAPEPNPARAPEGPVRVDIEESEDEEDTAAAADASAGQTFSLGRLTKKEFKDLVASLGSQESERVLFCKRRGSQETAKKEDSRKVDVKKIEEVMEPSRLDDVLRDAERVAVLFKKSKGNVVPLRTDVKYLGGGEAPEEKEAQRFLQTAGPRVLAVLHVLASSSDHHCALTAPAVRHVWPLITCPDWRYSVLELLGEWSQRTISARSMAEFASRHPTPHLQGLVDAMAKENKDNMLPPGFEDRAFAASQRLDMNAGEAGMDQAMSEMMAGLTKQSPAELAVSALGNISLPGQALPAFKEQMAPFCDVVVAALSKQLRPMNWRLCGKAAGALCNLLRLGGVFAEAIEKKCAKPLVDCLRDEAGQGGSQDSASELLKAMRAGGGQVPGGKMPNMESATVRLLSALINLLTVQPSSAQRLLGTGLLDISVGLLDPAQAATAGAEDGPDQVLAHAHVLVARLLTRAPEAISLRLEAQLLKRLFACLQGASAEVKEACAGGAGQGVERIELVARTLAVLINKTPGALDRMLQRAPRCEELPDDAAVGKLESPEPAVNFTELCSRLADVLVAARPRQQVVRDEEGGHLSRLRGNLSVLFASLVEAQGAEDAPSSLRDLDLERLAEPCVDALRKERGAVQNNIGVLVTRMAQSARYRQVIRDLNGMETLHQIQLPKVEAQKAEASRQHRIETNTDARQAEIRRRLEKAQKAN